MVMGIVAYFVVVIMVIWALDFNCKSFQELPNMIVVKDGVFGEEMEVSLLNHGPFTIIITTEDL